MLEDEETMETILRVRVSTMVWHRLIVPHQLVIEPACVKGARHGRSHV